MEQGKYHSKAKLLTAARLRDLRKSQRKRKFTKTLFAASCNERLVEIASRSKYLIVFDGLHSLFEFAWSRRELEVM